MYTKWWGATISTSYVLCFIYFFIFIQYHSALCCSGWPTEIGWSETVRPSAMAKDKIRCSKHSPADRSLLLRHKKKPQQKTHYSRFSPFFDIFLKQRRKTLLTTLQSHKVEGVKRFGHAESCCAYQAPKVQFKVVSKVITTPEKCHQFRYQVRRGSQHRQHLLCYWGETMEKSTWRCARHLAAACALPAFCSVCSLFELTVLNVQSVVIKREMRKHLFRGGVSSPYSLAFCITIVPFCSGP